jgi:nickel-dependent lactate racemase
MTALSHVAPEGTNLTPDQIRAFIAKACPPDEFRGKKVLLIVPDSTRTCPLDQMFAGVFDQISGATSALDVMIALGTHQPMSEEAICERLGITLEQRRSKFARVQLLNHAWDDLTALRKIGTITVEKSLELTGGLLAEEVPVEVNARIFDYDLLFVIGPVFPHEVVGFSGGNKYIFPGIIIFLRWSTSFNKSLEFGLTGFFRKRFLIWS